MSAAIRHIHYKPADEELSIWFGPEGRRYKYFGVPEFLYEAFRDAESRPVHPRQIRMPLRRPRRKTPPPDPLRLLTHFSDHS